MKKLVLLITLVLVLALSGCEVATKEELDNYYTRADVDILLGYIDEDNPDNINSTIATKLELEALEDEISRLESKIDLFDTTIYVVLQGEGSTVYYTENFWYIIYDETEVKLSFGDSESEIAIVLKVDEDGFLHYKTIGLKTLDSYPGYAETVDVDVNTEFNRSIYEFVARLIVNDEWSKYLGTDAWVNLKIELGTE